MKKLFICGGKSRRIVSFVIVLVMIVTMMPYNIEKAYADGGNGGGELGLSAEDAVKILLGENNSLITYKLGSAEFVSANQIQLWKIDENVDNDIKKYIEIDEGLIISSGDSKNILSGEYVGDNDDFTLKSNDLDSDLVNLLHGEGDDFDIYDLGSLRFKIKANITGTLVFKYSFASNEFTQDSQYNDIFGLFVKKSSDSDYVNLAKMETEENGEIVKKNITIFNLRKAIEESEYDNNAVSVKFNYDNDYTDLEVNDDIKLPFNGMTCPYFAEFNVVEGEDYDIKLSIADVSDCSVTSAVFIQGGSFDIVPSTPYMESNYLNPLKEGHKLVIENKDSKDGKICIYSRSNLTTPVFSKEVAGNKKILLEEKDVENIAKNGYGLYYVFFETGGKKSASKELTIGILKLNKPVEFTEEKEIIEALLMSNGGSANWIEGKNGEKNKLTLDKILVESEIEGENSALLFPESDTTIEINNKSTIKTNKVAIDSKGSIDMKGNLDIDAGICGIKCDTFEFSEGNLEINVSEGGLAFSVNKLIIPEDYEIIGGHIDKDGKFVQDTGATKVIIKHKHVHDKWSYLSNGATIIATCGEDECYLNDNKVTLTLFIDKHINYGNSAEVTIGTEKEKEIWIKEGLKYPNNSDIEYYKDGEKLLKAPTEIGKYVAKLNYEGMTASVDFEIEYSLADKKKMFEEYKETVSANCVKLIVKGDNDNVINLVEAAIKEIKGLLYDESKTLDENKKNINAIYEKLINDIKKARYTPGPEDEGKSYVTIDGNKSEFVCNYVVRDSSKKEYTVSIYKLKDKDGKIRYGLMNMVTHTMDLFGDGDSTDLEVVKKSIKEAFRNAKQSEIDRYVSDHYNTIPTKYIPMQSVKLKVNSVELFKEEGIELTDDVKFRITGSSKKETKAMKKIANVSKKGKIKPKRTGFVTIEAYKVVKDGKKKISNTVAKINVPIVKPKFNKENVAVYTGQTFDIEDYIKSVTISGNEFTGNTLARNLETAGYEISWKSKKNSKIASINSDDGVITVGEKSGVFKFRMIVKNPETNKSVTYRGKIIVKLPKLSVRKVKLNSAGKNASKTIKVLNLVDSNVQTVEWSVIDKTIAVVDSQGKVSAVGIGNTELVAVVKNIDGTTMELRCPVTVKQKK